MTETRRSGRLSGGFAAAITNAASPEPRISRRSNAGVVNGQGVQSPPIPPTAQPPQLTTLGGAAPHY